MSTGALRLCLLAALWFGGCGAPSEAQPFPAAPHLAWSPVSKLRSLAPGIPVPPALDVLGFPPEAVHVTLEGKWPPFIPRPAALTTGSRVKHGEQGP